MKWGIYPSFRRISAAFGALIALPLPSLADLPSPAAAPVRGVVKCASAAPSDIQRYGIEVQYNAAALPQGFIVDEWVGGPYSLSEYGVPGSQRGSTYSVGFSDGTSWNYFFRDWFFNPVILPVDQMFFKIDDQARDSILSAILFGTPFHGAPGFKFQKAEQTVTFSTKVSCEYVPPPEPPPRPFACPYKPTVNLVNVPFENRGFGVQFWEGYWAKLPGEAGYAEYLEAIDRLTCTNSNLIHLGFNVALVDSATGHVFSRDATLSPSDERMKHFFKLLKERNMKINLKPGFHYSDQPGWNMITFVPSDVDAWFAGWQEQLVHYAAIAQESGVDMFDINYEQSQLTYRFAPQWRKLISAVRAVYKGTISANFQNAREAQHSVFLDQLDLIMVSVFYNHTSSNSPSVAELTASWTDTRQMPLLNPAHDEPYSGISAGKSLVQELVDLHNVSGKPVLIGDIAFTSSDGAAANSNASLGVVDMQEQCDQFQAFFKAFTTSPQIGSWFKGVVFLHWFPFDWRMKDYRNLEIGPSGRAVRDKPSEKLVIDWYSGLGPATAPACL